MDKCLVYGCPNSLTASDTSIQFYYFPKHPVMVQQWLNACSIWNSDEVDLNTARICSIHFDNDSYTSEYKMVDYVGYARVLKYDALPTLYLPQQTIVYRVTNIDDENFTGQNYEASSVIIENTQNHRHQQEQIEDCVAKYEELQTVPLSSANDFVKIEENSVIEEKYKAATSYKQIEEIKLKNDKMRKEMTKLEQNVKNLTKKHDDRREEYRKRNVECGKLQKILSGLEMKSMSLSDQKNLLSKVFSESQIKILSGKKRIYWSHDDMAIGYTIRHMSSKRCYAYLSKKLNIPLPGLSSIKRWQTLKKNKMKKDNNEEKDVRNEDSDEKI